MIEHDGVQFVPQLTIGRFYFIKWEKGGRKHLIQEFGCLPRIVGHVMRWHRVILIITRPPRTTDNRSLVRTFTPGVTSIESLRLGAGRYDKTEKCQHKQHDPE